MINKTQNISIGVNYWKEAVTNYGIDGRGYSDCGWECEQESFYCGITVINISELPYISNAPNQQIFGSIHNLTRNGIFGGTNDGMVNNSNF